MTDGSLSDILAVEGKFYGLKSGTIQKYNIDQNKLEKIELTYKFHRNLDGGI